MSEDEVMKKLSDITLRMAGSADAHGVRGVAVAALYTQNAGLVSQARVCGALVDDKVNYLAIAFAKTAEMCNTLAGSGTSGRPLLHGELGYMGGAIKPAGDAYCLAAFSGAAGHIDLEISRAGLEMV